jgi:hypothetical protein
VAGAFIAVHPLSRIHQNVVLGLAGKQENPSRRRTSRVLSEVQEVPEKRAEEARQEESVLESCQNNSDSNMEGRSDGTMSLEERELLKKQLRIVFG